MPEDRAVVPPVKDQEAIDAQEVPDIPESSEDERQERIRARQEKIAEWIQKITARSQDIKNWSEHGVRTKNVVDKEPNIDDIDDFLGNLTELKNSLYEQVNEIETAANEILRKMKHAQDLGAEGVDELIAEAEAMFSLMDQYYEDKSQYEANLE